MKKIIFCLICLFILTGCDVTYTLDIDDDFNETIYVTSSNPQQLNNISSYKFNNPVYYDESNVSDEGAKLPNVKYYDYIYSNGITASYKFKNEYKRSNAVHYCFPSLTIDEDEYVKLRTTVDFKCFKLEPELDKVTVNIITKNQVVSHNADKVDGNTYTWVFEKNGSMKSIDIKYKNPNYKKSGGSSNINPNKNKQNKNNSSSNNKNKTKNSLMLYILLPLFFVGLFAIIIISKKKNK